MKKNVYDMTAVREAIYITHNYGTTAEVEAAINIRQAWAHEYGENEAFDFLCMLGAIYTAGRIDGVRSERRRRKE